MISSKTQMQVNLLVAALKKTGIKFNKDDVSVNDRIVRLSFDGEKVIPEEVTNRERIMVELKRLGYTVIGSIDRELDCGRRWYSFELDSLSKYGARFLSIDEVYCTVYIDC